MKRCKRCNKRLWPWSHYFSVITWAKPKDIEEHYCSSCWTR